MTAKELLMKIDAVDGCWEEYDCEAIPIVEKFRAEDRAEIEKNLKALMEGLEIQNIDTFISGGKVGDYRNLGKAYKNAVKAKIEEARAEALKDAADRAVAFIKLWDITGPLSYSALRAAITQEPK
jgi:hypothetical protein